MVSHKACINCSNDAYLFEVKQISGAERYFEEPKLVFCSNCLSGLEDFKQFFRVMMEMF